MPVKPKTKPKADAADVLFGDIPRPRSPGGRCIACNDDGLRDLIERILLGMLGEGPMAGKVSLRLSLLQIHRSLSDPEKMAELGVAVYPRKRCALDSHLREHDGVSELWERVKQAKRQAGYA